MATSETRDQILFALNELVRDNEAQTQKRRSSLAFLAIGARRKALEDAITIVKAARWD
ncbi:MAG: hypothetical protein ACO24S_06940 [Ilumatobacteraceae bacterium]